MTTKKLILDGSKLLRAVEKWKQTGGVDVPQGTDTITWFAREAAGNPILELTKEERQEVKSFVFSSMCSVKGNLATFLQRKSDHA